MVCVFEIVKKRKSKRGLLVRWTWCGKEAVTIKDGNSFCEKHAK